MKLHQDQFPVPYLHASLPDSLKWRVLGALMKINQRPSAYNESARRVILSALGAMNLAAVRGVREGREAIVANLLVEMVLDIEAIAGGHLMSIAPRHARKPPEPTNP
jgi:hypothetical protein